MHPCRRERRRWCLLQSSDVSVDAMKDCAPKSDAIGKDGIEVVSKYVCVWFSAKKIGAHRNLLCTSALQLRRGPVGEGFAGASQRMAWKLGACYVVRSLMRSVLQVPICGKKGFLNRGGMDTILVYHACDEVMLHGATASMRNAR